MEGNSNSTLFYDTVPPDSNSNRLSSAATSSRPSSYVDCSEDFEPSSSFSANMSTNDRTSWDSEDYERQVKRLETELKQTMDMYHAACKEALAAKRKAMEVEKWKAREEKRIEEARLLEDKVSLIVEKEKQKILKEATEAAQRLVQSQVEKRIKEELEAIRGFEEEDQDSSLDSLPQSLTVLKYKSLYHMVAVVFLFYFYFSISCYLSTHLNA
ncbi:hypothetical protein LINGRAHAP2_LOCUS2481 [Linum grandiflorum]